MRNLGERLKICASFVPLGARLADIGTDHGYLPIRLLKEGKIKSAVAADIAEKPLESALKNSEKYCVNLKTVLSNGFEKLKDSDFDTAVIAGMGGELIAELISKCTYIKSKTLVLQSMSNTHKLRTYLYENGFNIIREDTVKDKGKIYSVMLVKHGEGKMLCPYMGAIIPKSDYSVEYAAQTVKDLKNKLKSGEDLNSKIKEIEEKYMPKVIDIYDAMDKIAPFNSAMDFDNVGLLVGDKNATVSKAMLCLDITDDMIDEAINIGAQLIIAHHPVIFDAPKSVMADTILYKLIKSGISAICAHTNLDACDEIGINRALANILNLKNLRKNEGEYFYYAETDPISTKDLALKMKKALNTTVLFNNVEKEITKVVMCSGSGGNIVYSNQDIDAAICGEAKHHEFLEAQHRGIPLFAAGHYETEKIFDTLLKEYLDENIKGVDFVLSKTQKPTLTVI